MNTDDLVWEISDDWVAYLRGYLDSPYSFEETVARLITLSGQRPMDKTDEYKVSVSFEGFYKGEYFNLYDYKEDREIHIGGGELLDISGLAQTLLKLLRTVEPTPYAAEEYYDLEIGHSYPPI